MSISYSRITQGSHARCGFEPRTDTPILQCPSTSPQPRAHEKLAIGKAIPRYPSLVLYLRPRRQEVRVHYIHVPAPDLTGNQGIPPRLVFHRLPKIL